MDRLHPQLLFRRTFVSLSPSLQIATFKLDPQIPRPAEAEESLRFIPQGNWIIQKMKIYFGINLFSGKILLWKRHNLAPGVMIPTLPCSTIFWKYKNIHLNIKKYSSDYKRAGYATGSIIARTSAPDSSQASTRSFILAIIPISHISLLDFFQNCFGFHHEVFWIYWLF